MVLYSSNRTILCRKLSAIGHSGMAGGNRSIVALVVGRLSLICRLSYVVPSLRYERQYWLCLGYESRYSLCWRHVCCAWYRTKGSACVPTIELLRLSPCICPRWPYYPVRRPLSGYCGAFLVGSDGSHAEPTKFWFGRCSVLWTDQLIQQAGGLADPIWR